MNLVTFKWITVSVIARLGYIAKGIVYFMVGLLTIQTTIGLGGETSNTTDALQQIIYRPYGRFLLTGIMIGLIAHAIWRILQGTIDPENRGKDAGVALFRFIDFMTGCLYLSISYAAWQILQGLSTQDGGQTTEVWVGKILDLPFGTWLVMICAIAILAGGVYQFYSAWYARFDESFDKSDMSRKERVALRLFGRIGISAWGIVYCMVAYLFYLAAINYDADAAGGLSQALAALRQQPYGQWVLGITSAGLLIYGLYLLILSYYHRV